MSAILFCPECQDYIALRPACNCGWQRPSAAAEPVRFLDLAQPTDAPEAPQLPSNGRPVLHEAQWAVLPYGARGGSVGGITVVDLASHTELWRCEVAAPVEHVAVGSAMACFADGRGLLHLVDLRTRAEVASLGIGSPSASQPLMLADGSILVATREGAALRLDGRLRVARRAELTGPRRVTTFTSNWIQLGNDALVGTRGGTVQMFSARNGTLQPVAEVDGEITGLAASPRRDFVVISTDLGELIAFQPPVWRKPAWSRVSRGNGSHQRVNHAACLDGDLAYAASLDHEFACLNLRDGSVVWTYEHPYGLASPVTLGHGMALVADNRGQLLAVDRATGKRCWLFDAHTHRPCDDGRFAVMMGGAIPTATGFVIGSASSRVFQMDAVLGDWMLGLKRAQDGNDPLAAAGWLARSGTPDWPERAAAILAKSGRPLQAAALYGSRQMLYEQAVQLENAARLDPSAWLWQQAMNIWLRLGRQTEADECMRNAALIGQRPLLTVELSANGGLRVDEVCEFHIIVRNVTQYLANSVRATLLADNASGSEAAFEGRMSSAAEWRTTLRLTPRIAGDLQVRFDVSYRDDNGNAMPTRQWQARFRVAALSQPPTVMNVKTMVADGGKLVDQTQTFGNGAVVVQERHRAIVADDEVRTETAATNESPST